MPDRSNHRVLVPAAMLCLLATLPSLTPIESPDFWYHLATGRYIFTAHALPSTDLFSDASLIYDTGADASYLKDNLKGYWLAQLLMYLIFNVSGPYGIIALRALILTSAFTLSLMHARRSGLPMAAIALALLPSALAMRLFAEDRPQLWSFLFAMVMLMLAERFVSAVKEGRTRPMMYLEAPALIVLWANMHRGFPMGLAVLAVCLGGAWIAHAATARESSRRTHACRYATLIALTVAASMVNPNIYDTYLFIASFEGGSLQRVAKEYLSPLALAARGQVFGWYFAFCIVMLSGLVGSGRRPPIGQIAVAVFTGFLSLSAIRYIPFFLVLGLPVAASSIYRIAKRAGAEAAMHKRSIAIATVALIAIIILGAGRPTLVATMQSPLVEGEHPEGAASFVLEARPMGRLLNDFTWGGYLIWQLYPHYRVFTDTRTLSEAAVRDHALMTRGRPEGLAMLDEFGIRLIVMRALDGYFGKPYELVDHLVKSPEWTLVWADESALVFIRGEGNGYVATRHELPKAYAYRHALALADRLLMGSPPWKAANLEDSIR